MEIIKHDKFFFVSDTSSQDAVYTSSIQCIIEYEIILSLVEYASMLIMRSRGGALQILEIYKYISIPGIQRGDKKHISSNRKLFEHEITRLNRKFRNKFYEDQ
jgi:hypothetical protein